MWLRSARLWLRSTGWSNRSISWRGRTRSRCLRACSGSRSRPVHAAQPDGRRDHPASRGLRSHPGLRGLRRPLRLRLASRWTSSGRAWLPARTANWPRRADCWKRAWSSDGTIEKAGIVVAERAERGLGLPGHVRVGAPHAVLEDLDHAPAGHVEVLSGIAAMWQAVAHEGAREGGCDPLRDEDVQEFAQVGRLLLLVADVIALESHRRGPVVVDDLSTTGAVVGRAPVGRAAELGDRDRLALRDQRTHALPIDVGDFLRTVEVDRDDVERRPVHPLERHRGVRHLAAEPLPDNGHGPGEEGVDARGHLGQQLTNLRSAPEQVAGPLLDAVAGQEPGVE